jgi:hypothetical protein
LAAKYTLPANFFDTIGKQLLIKASGRISSVIAAPGTCRFDVRFGATVVFDGLAILLDTAAAAVTVPWELEILMTCRAIGATGNLFGVGRMTSPNLLGSGARPMGCLSAMLPWNTAPVVGANFDTTATQQVDLFHLQTVNTGSLIVHQYSLISPN